MHGGPSYLDNSISDVGWKVSGSHEISVQDVGWGLWSCPRLSWGWIPFQTHAAVGWSQVIVLVGKKGPFSCWFLARGSCRLSAGSHPQLQNVAHSSWLSKFPTWLLVFSEPARKKNDSSKMNAMILCGIITHNHLHLPYFIGYEASHGSPSYSQGGVL